MKLKKRTKTVIRFSFKVYSMGEILKNLDQNAFTHSLICRVMGKQKAD